MDKEPKIFLEYILDCIQYIEQYNKGCFLGEI